MLQLFEYVSDQYLGPFLQPLTIHCLEIKQSGRSHHFLYDRALKGINSLKIHNNTQIHKYNTIECAVDSTKHELLL